MKRIATFVFAGAIGFVVDAAAFIVLLATTPLHPFAARLLSIACALLVTWQINRHVTFGPSERAPAAEGARYGGIGIITSAINYLAFSAALLVKPGTPPMAALVLASVVTMAFSYLGYSRWVFGQR